MPKEESLTKEVSAWKKIEIGEVSAREIFGAGESVMKIPPIDFTELQKRNKA
ncbi:MAG: hypothetical protein LBS10_06285 [Gracilibacteraceae bacterium]|nr:hypothetical protein [Gracilibacteraceae bacterium]